MQGIFVPEFSCLSILKRARYYLCSEGFGVRDRIRELRRVKASDLVPNPKNWRKHPEHQVKALQAMLNDVGFAGAQIARELPDGRLMLIDGHARASVAGDAEIPVLILDVTAEEADKILLTFDPLSQKKRNEIIK